jgi:hypothetical protein
MAEYAQVYGDFKMADGTFKITKHDKVYVFWTVVDSLLCTIVEVCWCDCEFHRDSHRVSRLSQISLSWGTGEVDEPLT